MTDFRPGGFSVLPPVIKNLLIVNVLIFFAQYTFRNNTGFSIEGFFALHDVRSYYFKPHQLITYMFLHGGVGHLFFNMFALWMFGSTLENLWGAKRFLIFYVVCGLGAGALHLLTLYFEMMPTWEKLQSPFLTMEDARRYYGELNQATLGASGSVFGCLAAFGYLFPNSLIYIYFLFPIKAKWFVMIYAGLELMAGIQNSAGDNVAHWAHLGGAGIGILMVIYWNKTNRRRFY